MSNEPQSPPVLAEAGPAPRDNQTLGSSTIYRLCEEVISLRERNNRQHQEFERKLTGVRDELKGSFNTFAADTQRAYQQLRQEMHGEKRVGLALLNELLEVGQDLQHIVAARPAARRPRRPRALGRGRRGRVAQGPGGPAAARHPSLRRRHQRPVQPRPARARRQHARRGHGAAASSPSSASAATPASSPSSSSGGPR